MKRFVLFIILFTLLISKVNSQITFQEKFNLAPSTHSCTIGAFSNGGFVFSSIVQASSFSPFDFNLTSIDSSGTIVWSKKYGGGGDDEGYFPIQTSDGNIIISGSVPVGTVVSVLLAKIDLLNGNVIWAKSIGVNGIEASRSTNMETHDKGFAVLGVTWSIGAGDADFYLMRTDSMGNLLWAKSYGGNNNDNACSLIETKDHGFIIIGETYGFNAQGQDLLILKTDSLGNLEWSKKYNGGAFHEFAVSINETPDNGYLISGMTNSFGNGNYNLYLIKTDINGTPQWFHVYVNFTHGYNSKITSNFEIIAGGSARDSSLNNVSTCIMKTDSLGNIIWNKIYSRGFGASNVEPTPDNGYVQIGVNGYWDTLFVVKTDMNGNSGCIEKSIPFSVISPNIVDSSVTILVDSGGTATNFTLPAINVVPLHWLCSTTSINENNTFGKLEKIEIFPNPTNDFITIHYNLSSPNQTTLSLFNLYGQELKTILNEKQPAGEHEMKMEMKDLEQGVYFVKMSADGKEEVRKIIKY